MKFKYSGTARAIVAILLSAANAVSFATASTNPPAFSLPTVVVLGNVITNEKPASPSAAISIPAETVAQKNLRTVREALTLIPNVLASEGDGSHAAFFSVRGSREIPFHELTFGRSGVGFYADDVPSLDNYGRDLTLQNVESIEFFKGPHGTAFGAPHSMGVFNVTTFAPNADWRGQAAYQFGSYDLHEILANLSGPICSNLFFGVEGRWFERDGFLKQTNGERFGDQFSLSGKARLRWLVTERLALDFTVGLAHHDDDPPVYVNGRASGSPFRAGAHPGSFAERDQDFESLRATWGAEAWQIKSITARQAGEFKDYDPNFLLEVFAPFSVVRLRDQETTAWSQEFRAESTDPDADWRWRSGIFLGWRDYSFFQTNRGLGLDEGAHDLHSDHDDYALYGEITRVVAERLELSAGLRLQTTRTHTRSQFTPSPFAAMSGATPAATDGNKNFNGALPMAALQWNWNSTHHIYFRFSSGLQPGDLRVAASGSTDFAAERSWHYELGHQVLFFQERLQMNAAAFYSDYRDYQSFQFYPGNRTVFNAARAHAVGVEIELRTRPLNGLELYAGGGYTDARFDDFDSPIGNFDDQRINNIPDFSIVLGAQARAEWGGLARVDWRYVGDLYFEEANTVKQNAYALLDARIGWERDHLGIYFFGRNLFDTEYHSQAYLFGGAVAAVPGAPVTLGMEARAKF